MTDWVIVFQYVTSFLAGSGLTAIATTIYERREMSKQSKREYFNKLILKPELFRYLTGLMELYDFLTLDLPELRQTGKLVKIVHGKPRTFKSELELLSAMMMSREGNEQMKQLRESGVFFLMSRKLQTAINNLWYNLPRQATDAEIRKYSELMTELRNCLTKEFGIG